MKIANDVTELIGNTPLVRLRGISERTGAEVVANSPAEMAARIKSDTERYATVVKQANIKVE